MNKPVLWTKDFIILSSTNFLTHVIFYLLMTTIVMYVTIEFHASPAIAGLTAGLFVLASLLARLVAGKFLDKIGRKKALIGALLVCTIVMALHLVAGSLLFLLILRFIQGATHGFITTAAGAIVADLVPKERRGEGIGYYATAMNIAMATGPFLGIYLSKVASFDIIFLVGSVIALLDLLVALFLKVPNSQKVEEKRVSAGFKIRDFLEPNCIPISLAIFAIGLGYSSLLSFVSLYAQEIQLEHVASYFFLVYAAALLIMRPFTGGWFDNYGENVVTYPLMICLSLGFFILSLASNGLVFLLAGALIGIGFGTVQSNFQAIAITEATQQGKSLATSTYYIFLDLATGIGPYLLGILIGLLSFRQLYLTVALWTIVCIGIYYIVHGKKAAIRRKSTILDQKQKHVSH